jgi:hypothetical protein
MNKNRKHYIILTSIILVSLLLVSMVIPAQPGDGDSIFDEIVARLTGVESDVDDLSEDVLVLQTELDLLERIDELLERIHELETKVTVLETCGCEEEANGFPEPDYDSGWFDITEGTAVTKNHGLGTDELFVYVFGRAEGETITYTHQVKYGGDYRYDIASGVNEPAGLYWLSMEDEIQIFRYADDVDWMQARILIWTLPPQ